MATNLDLLKNVIDDKSISFYSDWSNIVNNNNRRVIVKIELKDGVDTFYNPFTSSTYYVHTGVSSDRNASTQPSSKYVTIIFRGNRYASYALNHGNASNLSNFFSQIKKIDNPLPFNIVTNHYNLPLTIDSPDFEAPNGLFDSPYVQPLFRNCTFKKAPRIYSDYALEHMVQFPPMPFASGYQSPSESRTSAWKPFESNEHLESIEYQGDLNAEKIQFLSRCDFSFYDSSGRPDLSAWPRIIGEYNGDIFGYVSTHFISVSNAPRLFESIGPGCKIVYKPYDCEGLIIDNRGAYDLPFLGLSFENCTQMEKLVLSSCEILMDVDLDGDYVREAIKNGNLQTEQNEKLNLQFSLSALGIQAPQSCKQIEGLHNIYATFYNPLREGTMTRDIDMTHVTPDSLDTIIYPWGQALKGLWDENFQMDVNNVPLMPDNVEYLSGYYYKKITGNDLYREERTPRPFPVYEIYDFENYGNLGDWKDFDLDSLKGARFLRNVKKDGADFTIQIPPFAHKMATNVNTSVHNYARNLYAHTIIKENIVIPALPSNCETMVNCYAGTFAFAGGTFKNEVDSDDRYDIQFLYSESSYATPGEGGTFWSNAIKAQKDVTTGKLAEILNDSVTNGFKARQIMGTTTAQNQEFSDEVTAIQERSKGQAIKEIIGSANSRFNKYLGLPSLVSKYVLKNGLPDFNAPSGSNIVKSDIDGFLDDIEDVVVDEVIGTNSALTSVYNDYPSISPNSSLEKTFYSAQEWADYIDDFAAGGEEATVTRYINKNSVTIEQVSMPSLKNSYATQYRCYYMSEFSPEDFSVSYIFSQTPSKNNYWWIKEAFYFFPNYLLQGTPLITFDTYVERNRVATRNDFATLSAWNKFLENTEEDSREAVFGYYITAVLSKQTINTEEYNQNFKFDFTNLLNAIPAAPNSITQKQILVSAFPPSLINQKYDDIRAALQAKGYTEDTANTSRGKTLELGNSIFDGKQIGYDVKYPEEHILKTSKAHIPGTPWIKKFYVSEYRIAKEFVNNLYYDRQSSYINLEDDLSGKDIN